MTRSDAASVILVVDDEPDVRFLTSWHLKQAGYEVRELESGEAALDALDGVDLIVLDYRLPGLTGLDTLRAINDRSGPPVVMMTAMGSEALAVDAMRAGAIDYLAKGGDYLARLPEIIERSARLHRLTRRVEESQRLAEGLLEAAPDAIVVVDAEGRIELVNRQTRALFGWEREELVGQQLEVLMPARFRDRHPDLVKGYRDDPLVRPMGADLELVACRRDGTEFPVAVSLSPLQTEHGLLISAAIRDITDRKHAEAALAHQATHDVLTGLPNRILLKDRLTQALERTRRNGTKVAVLFLDVDRLKVINDSRGHSTGDELLQAISSRLTDAMRSGDTLARFGGDEFVIVTEGISPANGPDVVARRIAAALVPPINLGGTDVSVSVSIGVTIAGPGDDAESLLRDADAAMYRAKDGGGGQSVVFDAAMRVAASGRLDAEHSLRLAMERSEFQVHYQPIVGLTDGRVIGFEALVRWCHPESGVVLPADFIPLTEETGLVVALGASVLREACHQLAEWHHSDERFAGLSMSVNLSARQLLIPELRDVVRDALRHSGISPALLCLEITESVLLADVESSTRALHSLKALGIRVAVDDFGTGYSSLTYLKRFPIDALKIDRTFVDGLGDVVREREDRAIVAAVIDVAHAFGLTTIAEGAETEQQVVALRALGCENAQGYYWGEPLPADATLDWLLATAVHGVSPVAAADAPDMARVLIVDDDRAVRGLARLLLDGESGFDVVGEAEDGRQGVALARHYQPDLVLLDLAMPGVGGLEALALIKAVAPSAKVVVFSGLDAGEFEAKATAHGAVGFIQKGGDPDRVAQHLHQLLARAG
ncbi:MAG TPA: EAL domain-containing protein [Acidimicrobiales bacterium]|nr:EAL domain-containing protein [Acidimicrobiales bacterium]